MLSPEEVKRAAFLHEAGHAVVAHELGLIVHEVVCDGVTGHCRADLSAADNAHLEQVHKGNHPISTVNALRQVLDAYFKKLCTLMGGIAGESLEPGQAVFSTRRASDDFASFFGFMAAMSRGLRIAESDPVWLEFYAKAQDEAWRIVREREADVRRVAAELEHHGALARDEFLMLL